MSPSSRANLKENIRNLLVVRESGMAANALLSTIPSWFAQMSRGIHCPNRSESPEPVVLVTKLLRETILQALSAVGKNTQVVVASGRQFGGRIRRKARYCNSFVTAMRIAGVLTLPQPSVSV